MSYQELISKALKGRSVNSVAKILGIPQPSLDRYVKGTQIPNYDVAFRMAEEAGVPPGEAFKMLADEAKRRKEEGQKPSFSRCSK
ncbi:helix-turn-helix domain-containing protein [Paraburkholderia megapolitana]|uniref:Helix-turn-helix n=1 Tax=Paraburkholderia megapolitana TaxID=420953 RepID=A0A1I3G199_9BURK|nr:helix-turn-helix transcriptional regulator [Paraburkholderia megapolitana]QDQ82652.1 helix-turn-helix transcriptional regulator [Paraburkholderia megapolitana]SFI17187.1 Helix-turn-helix [Paraburkholderia megapolitana]